ncbi:hypothetical protein HPB47_004866 [Ixodes persulcatus]|uniref:Uncharacterized protein n=1 Tax=Ixodes persulcatus TaxID=34615 RepID=A0AC60PEH6_IXOPE|nr:hypothetical protein HPB47_004866 [Ixodes persulcatus]
MDPTEVTSESDSPDSSWTKQPGAALPATPKRFFKKHKRGRVLNSGQRPNATKHVAHHILIYGCESPGYREWDTPRAVWDCGEMATSHSMFHKGPTCRTGSQIIYAWAMDAPALKLPEGVGFKIGGNSGINYLVLQVHYADTTAFLDGQKRDSSGIVLSLVPGDTNQVKRRAGVYVLGTGGMIRAHTKENFESACRINENLTLYPFAFRTHTHKLGKAVTGYVVRKGRWTNIGKHSPQEPQMFYPAKKGLKIVKGDVLAARCTMQNFRDRDTYVGPTGNDEMCNFYIMYYVDGDRILNDKQCFSYGPPIYYWHSDPLLRDDLTTKVNEDASTLD